MGTIFIERKKTIMNSWEIVKEELTKDAMPNSIGYTMDVNKAAKIFIKLKDVLNDFDIAVKTFNADAQVGKALRQKRKSLPGIVAQMQRLSQDISAIEKTSRTADTRLKSIERD